MKTLKTLCVATTTLFCLTSCENDTVENTSATNYSEVQEDYYLTEDDFNTIVSNVEKETRDNLNTRTKPPVKTVDYVDLNRYAGRWYEIAKYPNFFSIGCTCTTADYGLNDDKQSVSVFNNCTIAFTDIKNNIKGTATVVDTKTNSKLKVKFPSVPGPAGDYWIIDLATLSDSKTAPYDFAVVSNPDRDQLFILSRTPQLKTQKQRDALLNILRNLRKQRFKLFKLQVSPQLGDCDYPNQDDM